MSERILCITDDLTGALDVGGSFRSRGFHPRVYINPSLPCVNEDRTQIFNLRTRYAQPTEGKSRTTSAIEEIRPFLHNALLYVKVDSTLRGPVFQTIDILCDHFPKSPIFLAPSFPHAGRTCVNGVYYVEGVPISDTVYARDSAFHMESSRLTNGRKDILHVNFRDIDYGAEKLQSILKRSAAQVISFDTYTQQHLETIASVAMNNNAIMVGSSGLARAIPQIGDSFTDSSFDDHDPFMFVVGSLNPRSREQLKILELSGLPIFQLRNDDVANLNQIEKLQTYVSGMLDQGASCGVATPNELRKGSSYFHDLDQTMAKICSSASPHHLVLTGGETATEILISRGVSRLDVVSEHAPGIPIASRGRDSKHRIIAKPGGFGRPDEFKRIYQYHKP